MSPNQVLTGLKTAVTPSFDIEKCVCTLIIEEHPYPDYRGASISSGGEWKKIDNTNFEFQVRANILTK